jgi:glycerol-3-phosphate acyltransferase PlsY
MKKRLLLHLFGCFVLFMCGMVVASSLTMLIGYNQDYHASCWKIFFAAIIFLGTSIALKEK